MGNVIKGYKVFNPDFTAKQGGFKYSENTEFKHEGKIKICASGFHFCTKASHCFSYYEFNSKNIVCEVEARGLTETHSEDSKVCTDILFVGRKLTWAEVLEVANEGSNNTGHSNTGDSNTGDSNTGDSNTGGWNTGYRNTGYRNTGDRNTGGWNTGDRNTGDRNTGDSNTGGWNTGGWNTGYSNTGDRNTGVFCTGEKYILMFNKKSKWTMDDFTNSNSFKLLSTVDTKLWVYSGSMSEKEKTENKGWETADGFYRDIPFKDAFKDKWHNWNAANRAEFTGLPNFDKKIFFEITGVEA